jgi:hypothetical protein
MIKIINLKSAITLTCLFNLNNLVFSQSASTENCVVNPYNIYRAAIKYEGGCKNNKAEGNGNLYLNNGEYIKGVFKNNTLDENYAIELHGSGNTLFGQAINFKLNGPVQLFNGRHVSLKIFENGIHKGDASDDDFVFPAPKIDIETKINSQSHHQSSFLIPNTQNYVGANMTEMSIYNVESNKVSFYYKHGLNAGIDIKGISNDNTIVYVVADFGVSTTSGWVSKKKLKYAINLKTKANLLLKDFPESLTKSPDFIFNEKYKTVQKKPYGWNTSKKSVVTSDKKSVYFVPSSLYKSFSNEEMKLVSDTILKLDINGNVLSKKTFTNSKISDFIIDESNNRILIAYNSKDSTKLSAFKIENFDFINDIFSTEKSSLYNLYISNSGNYLSAACNYGTIIFLNDKFYYCFEGALAAFNEKETLVIGSDNNKSLLTAYNLEYRTISWRKKLSDYQVSSSELIKDNLVIQTMDGKYFKLPLNYEATPSWQFAIKTNTIQENSSVSISQNTVNKQILKTTQVCNWKPTKPTLSFVLVDNRKLCYCCNQSYARYSLNSPENIKSSKNADEINYLEALLDKHLEDSDADDKHKSADRSKLSEFALKTYGASLETFAQSMMSVYANALMKAYAPLMGGDDRLTNRRREIDKYNLVSKYCSTRCERDPRCY